MTNVIEFKQKEKPVEHMATLHIYANGDREYEIEVEINNMFDDGEVFEALLASAAKFAIHTGVADDDDDGISPY